MAAANAFGVFLELRLRENDLLAARAEIEAVTAVLAGLTDHYRQNLARDRAKHPL